MKTKKVDVPEEVLSLLKESKLGTAAGRPGEGSSRYPSVSRGGHLGREGCGTRWGAAGDV